MKNFANKNRFFGGGGIVESVSGQGYRVGGVEASRGDGGVSVQDRSPPTSMVHGVSGK